MQKDDILTAAHCDHNYLWKCKHKDNHGKDCTGPCELMTVLGEPLTTVSDEKKV